MVENPEMLERLRAEILRAVAEVREFRRKYPLYFEDTWYDYQRREWVEVLDSGLKVDDWLSVEGHYTDNKPYALESLDHYGMHIKIDPVTKIEKPFAKVGKEYHDTIRTKDIIVGRAEFEALYKRFNEFYNFMDELIGILTRDIAIVKMPEIEVEALSKIRGRRIFGSQVLAIKATHGLKRLESLVLNTDPIMATKDYFTIVVNPPDEYGRVKSLELLKSEHQGMLTLVENKNAILDTVGKYDELKKFKDTYAGSIRYFHGNKGVLEPYVDYGKVRFEKPYDGMGTPVAFALKLITSKDYVTGEWNILKLSKYFDHWFHAHLEGVAEITPTLRHWVLGKKGTFRERINYLVVNDERWKRIRDMIDAYKLGFFDGLKSRHNKLRDILAHLRDKFDAIQGRFDTLRENMHAKADKKITIYESAPIEDWYMVGPDVHVVEKYGYTADNIFDAITRCIEAFVGELTPRPDLENAKKIIMGGWYKGVWRPGLRGMMKALRDGFINLRDEFTALRNHFISLRDYIRTALDEVKTPEFKAFSSEQEKSMFQLLKERRVRILNGRLGIRGGV